MFQEEGMTEFAHSQEHLIQPTLEREHAKEGDATSFLALTSTAFLMIRT